MISPANKIHFFLESNLPEYRRRDLILVCKFYLHERKIRDKNPIATTMSRFQDFKKFMTMEWQGTHESQTGYHENKQREPEHGRCSCGGFFVIRINKRDGNKFLGCSKYPQCKNTATI